MLKLCSSIKTNVWYLRSLEKLSIKMWFSFIFAKDLKDRHFVVGVSKNLKLSTNTCFGVSLQKNVLSSFLLFLSVCYQDDLGDSERNETASLTARNFNNSWLLYVKFSDGINLCRNIWLIQNWKCQLFLFSKYKTPKRITFSIFQRQFLRNAWPCGYDFWRVFRDLC